MTLKMSLDLTKFKGKPVIGADMRIHGTPIKVYIRIKDVNLQEKMRKDNSLVQTFIEENRKEIEKWLYNHLKELSGFKG